MRKGCSEGAWSEASLTYGGGQAACDHAAASACADLLLSDEIPTPSRPGAAHWRRRDLTRDVAELGTPSTCDPWDRLVGRAKAGPAVAGAAAAGAAAAGPVAGTRTSESMRARRTLRAASRSAQLVGYTRSASASSLTDVWASAMANSSSAAAAASASAARGRLEAAAAAADASSPPLSPRAALGDGAEAPCPAPSTEARRVGCSGEVASVASVPPTAEAARSREIDYATARAHGSESGVTSVCSVTGDGTALQAQAQLHGETGLVRQHTRAGLSDAWTDVRARIVAGVVDAVYQNERRASAWSAPDVFASISASESWSDLRCV
jgi:hypothetical protein